MMVSFKTEKLLFEKFFSKFSFLKETDNQKIHLMTFMNHGKSSKPLSNLVFSFNLRSHAQSSVIYKFVSVSKIWWYYERHCVFFLKENIVNQKYVFQCYQGRKSLNMPWVENFWKANQNSSRIRLQERLYLIFCFLCRK